MKLQTILIVCEGEKTEPNYFEAFPVNKEIVKVHIEGTGYNTASLVKQAIAMKKKAQKEGNPYNQVWCVFDRDSLPADTFNQAFSIAERKSIRIAYSNEAFELWYLLHFDYHTSALSRE